MNNSLVSLYESQQGEGLEESKPFSNLPSRAECLERVRKSRGFDLLVIGGGLTGVCAAHQAALRGLRVLVVEEEYFGARSSLWNIAYAHAMRAPIVSRFRSAWAVRSIVNSIPGHLARPCVMLAGRPQDRLGGVSPLLHRIFAKISFRYKSAARAEAGLELPAWNEKRLIRETVLAARQEGAVCLSGIATPYVEAESDTGCYIVGLKDNTAESETDDASLLEVRAGAIVVDPSLTDDLRSRLGSRVGPKISDSALYRLILCRVAGVDASSSPNRESGAFWIERCDFGECIVSFASPEMIQIAVHKSADLEKNSSSEAIAEAVCHAAGLKLVSVDLLRGFRQGEERENSLQQVGGILLPKERGPWDSFRSVQQILRALYNASPNSFEKPVVGARILTERSLPGTPHGEEIARFRELAAVKGLSRELVDEVVLRWGGRVRYLSEFEGGLEKLSATVLRGEVELALLSDQVSTLDDLVFGSLSLERSPNWRSMLPLIASIPRTAALPRRVKDSPSIGRGA